MSKEVYLQFMRWDHTKREFFPTDEKVGFYDPQDLDSVFVSETSVKIYLKKKVSFR